MNNHHRKETKTRSALKALSWRIVATLTTITIAYIITGETKAALTIGGIEFFLKFIIYYFHERAWQFSPTNNEDKNALITNQKD